MISKASSLVDVVAVGLSSCSKKLSLRKTHGDTNNGWRDWPIMFQHQSKVSLELNSLACSNISADMSAQIYVVPRVGPSRWAYWARKWPESIFSSLMDRPTSLRLPTAALFWGTNGGWAGAEGPRPSASGFKSSLAGWEIFGQILHAFSWQRWYAIDL